MGHNPLATMEEPLKRIRRLWSQGNQQEFAQLSGAAMTHLMHDAGHLVAQELVTSQGFLTVMDAIIAQRVAGKGLYQLDLKALGATQDQIDRALVHQKALREEAAACTDPQASAVASAVQSYLDGRRPGGFAAAEAERAAYSNAMHMATRF